MFDTFWNHWGNWLSRRTESRWRTRRSSRRRRKEPGLLAWGGPTRLAVEPLEQRIVLDTMRWVGGGMTSDWSFHDTATGLTNWFDVTTNTAMDALPHDGDDLVFDNTATGFRTNNNDFTNLQINSLAISGDNYDITGNALTLAFSTGAGITFDAPTTGPIVDTDLTFNTASSLPDLTNNGAPARLDGNIDLHGSVLTVAGSGNINISTAAGKGVISSSTGGGSLIQHGTGTLFLEGANTFQNGTMIESGQITVRNDSALGSGSVMVSSGGTLALDGSGGNLTVANALQVQGAGVGGNTGAIRNLAGANTLTGNVALAADTAVAAAASTQLTLQGVISSGTTTTLTEDFGTGTVVLGGANTYQGPTVIASGTLQAGAANVIPATSDVTLSQAGATLDLHGFSQVIGSLSGVEGTTVNLGSATLTVGMSNLAEATFAGTITGTGGLTKVGTGTETLGGSMADAFTGLTTVTAGILALDKPDGVLAVGGNVVIGPGTLRTLHANQVPSTALVTVNSPGALDLMTGSQTIGELAGSGNVTLDAAGIQLTVGDSGNSTFSGAITEPNGPSGGLVKVGTGTLTLTGTNTYVGPTVIMAGTLLVNGMLSMSPISLMAGTLGGTGTVGDITATGGTLAPGSSGPGILTAHNVTLNSSTTFHAILNGPTAGSGYSQLVASGTINLGNSTLTSTRGFIPPAGTALILIRNTGSGAVQGTFRNLPEGQKFSIAGQSFQISYQGGGMSNVVVTATQSVSSSKVFAIGGAPGLVQVRSDTDGSLVVEFAPYGANYTGPISVAVGDVTGDGFLDIITGAMVGNPDVRVFDGRAIANGTFDPNNPSASLLAQFFPYQLQFNVGANVAVGDIEHNGFADIVTGATVGNPDVRVYRGRDIANRTFEPTGASLIAQWFPYALQFNVGANVAVGDVTGDGFADVVTGATAGNPDVRVYNGKDIAQGTFNPTGSSLLAQFFPYALQFNVGAFVAVGDTTGDGFGDVITGASVGNPDVRVYRGADIAHGTFQNSNPGASLLTQFFAYGVNFNVGAAVASADFEGTGKSDILTGASSGSPNYRVVKGNATGTVPPALFEGIPSDLQGGISVGA